jgi:hypothetical protein
MDHVEAPGGKEPIELRQGPRADAEERLGTVHIEREGTADLHHFERRFPVVSINEPRNPK